MRESEITQFQNKILDWYTDNKRDLPRRDTSDPYKVLVSETMLQQTQVDRVVPKFLHWMDMLPALSDLAHVEKSTLLSMWSGLGFNSRAVRLQQCAVSIVRDHNSIIPKNRETLLNLPGIGPYTSGAILAFAYNQDVPVVDTNIRRVLIWELGLEENITPKMLEEVAMRCLPCGQANDRYNALMDYGSLVATAKATGIKPTSKQSKFAGSPRETRGKILRYLLNNTNTTENMLRKKFPHEKFDQILIGMVRDDIICMKDNKIYIA